MRFVSHKLALLALASVALGPFAACHTALASETPRAMTPTIDVEIEDRAADKSSHIARFSLSVIDGKSVISTRDGDASYDVEARAQPTGGSPNFLLKLKRSPNGAAGEIEIASAVPQHPGARMLVAKIERADGRLTSVVAQVR